MVLRAGRVYFARRDRGENQRHDLECNDMGDSGFRSCRGLEMSTDLQLSGRTELVGNCERRDEVGREERSQWC